MTLHVFISGQVQGVGYRRFVKRHAQKLGLTGWVRNIPDRRVEATFSGSKEQIDEILKICKKGPFLSEVTRVETQQSEEEAFDDFKIVV
ncbi:MAG TPA: acylphosphatase [Candidatus Saccharimonadales bacterium]|nr:acylphosphatase [Candidatus Saccharimonadales bacterium]